MAFQLQTLPGQFSPPNPYDELTRGMMDFQKMQSNQLAQQREKTELKYLDRELALGIKKTLADIGLTEAQTESSRQNTYLQDKYGSQKFQVEIDALKALEQQRLKQPSGSGYNSLWRSLPPTEREYYGAVGRSMGLDVSAMARLINEGFNLDEIGAQQGFSPEELRELTPQYLATAPTRTATQKRLAAESEIEYLTPKVTEAISKYINPYNIAGYSPEQIFDMVSGQNVDKQAEFMAANMIWPEIIYNRLRLANAETGVTAFEHMQSVTPTFVKQYSGFMRPEVFMKAQEKANKWLSEASRHAAKVSLNPSEYFKGETNRGEAKENDNDPLGIR